MRFHSLSLIFEGAVSSGTTHSPVAEHHGYSLHFSAQKEEEIGFSPALVALGELEFRKAFLLLSYIGR